MRLAASLLASCLLALPALAQDNIAKTDPKSPADERKAFKLPPGFEAQLVASEPDIGKPIQIAFDAKGRLWVTTSRLYPFPAPDDKGTDKLYVLSDFGPDGKARKITVFADDLNIPIGILPLPDCKSCLVSSAGYVYKLTDTDGDGKADKRETILSGYGHRDTHGMTNSFTLLPDGWVYACHGFSNESVVRGTDGRTITMQSGNTYRFRPDGSGLEHWTFGQVNPFGMTVDPWLNIYTADCHSKPITQLIRGAYYSSFGKPDDGLGFAPHVTQHDHGSTALCGLTWYDADQFPPEYKGCMFLGNVVTNRINFDRIEWHGSTPVGKEQPDFLISGDPWFRPTDMKLGPDGALYVTDFYNRIIGHYEVPLNHPGRDKDRGRLWRIVWKGTDGKAKPPEMPFKDLTTASDAAVFVDLVGHPCLTTHLLALNEALRRSRRIKDSKELGVVIYHGPGPARREFEEAARTWVTGQSTPDSVLMSDKPVPGHKMPIATLRVLGARTEWDAKIRAVVLHVLTPDDALPDGFARWSVVRAAVDALIGHPHADNVAPLVKVIQTCPKDDTHLRHAARIALRNALRDAPGAWAEAEKADPAVIADVAHGTPTKDAAAFLLKRLQADRIDPRACERVGRYGDDAQAAAVVAVLKGKESEQPAAVLGLEALHRGVQARGSKLPADVGPVAEAVCVKGLASGNPFGVQAAADLAAVLKLKALFDPLTAFAARADRNPDQRAAALTALMGIDPAKAAPVLGKTLTDPAAPERLRERTAQVLAGASQPAAREALLAALAQAPARLAGVIAAGLASTPRGADTLLNAVKQGKASARLLQERAVSTRLLSLDGGRLKPRVDELTRGLPSADAKIEELIRARSGGFRKAKADPKRGQAVFTQHCAACHQIAGQGQRIGPSLDGVGNRGPDRLCEDILDPNRNVDVAFRATVLNLLDGRTLTGLVLREEGPVTVLADSNGKEQRVEQKDIDRKTTSVLSPMPANFDAAIPEADFYHLLAYLLEQRAKDPPK